MVRRRRPRPGRAGRRRARRASSSPDRIDVPAPFLLIVVGVAASYVPGVPQVHLEPRSCCSGCCRRCCTPPRRTSLVDFNANRRPILLLSVGLVALHDAFGVGGGARRCSRASRGPVAFAHRCRRRAAGRGRRDRDRSPDRAAAPDRHDPRGRVAAQRRHRAGRAGHRAGGRPAAASPWAGRPGLRDRRRRRRARRPRVLPGRGRAAPAPRRPGARQRAVAGGARSRPTSPPSRSTPPA